MIAEARLHAAMVAGLLSRTYFRNRADAVKRTGLAGADMQELARHPQGPGRGPRPPAAARSTAR